MTALLGAIAINLIWLPGVAFAILEQTPVPEPASNFGAWGSRDSRSKVL